MEELSQPEIVRFMSEIEAHFRQHLNRQVTAENGVLTQLHYLPASATLERLDYDDTNPQPLVLAFLEVRYIVTQQQLVEGRFRTPIRLCGLVEVPVTYQRTLDLEQVDLEDSLISISG